MTPAGIEPATFRFVAQHLNHCATAVPTGYIIYSQTEKGQDIKLSLRVVVANVLIIKKCYTLWGKNITVQQKPFFVPKAGSVIFT